MNIREEIKNYISNELITEKNDVAWDDDTDIIMSGILDSISIVRLLAYIEDNYDVNLDDSLDLDNFKSINSICSLLDSKNVGK